MLQHGKQSIFLFPGQQQLLYSIDNCAQDYSTASYASGVRKKTKNDDVCLLVQSIDRFVLCLCELRIESKIRVLCAYRRRRAGGGFKFRLFPNNKCCAFPITPLLLHYCRLYISESES